MKEASITIGGKPYLLTALDAQAMRELHDEFKATAPCPVKELVATANELPEGMREAYITKNLDNAIVRKRGRNSLDSVEFKQWMEADAITSAERIYHTMFRKHHPELTRQECFALAIQAIEEGGEDVFKNCFPVKLGGAKANRGHREKLPAK